MCKKANGLWQQMGVANFKKKNLDFFEFARVSYFHDFIRALIGDKLHILYSFKLILEVFFGESYYKS